MNRFAISPHPWSLTQSEWWLLAQVVRAVPDAEGLLIDSDSVADPAALCTSFRDVMHRLQITCGRRKVWQAPDVTVLEILRIARSR